MTRHPLRAVLVAVVIAVGIASVVSTVSLIDGGRAEFAEDLQKIGLEVINIHPEARTFSLSQPPTIPPEVVAAEEEALRARGARVAPITALPTAVGGEGAAEFTLALGTTHDLAAMSTLGLRGRFFSEEDEDARAEVCVLDEALARRLFPGGGEPLGAKLRVRLGEASRVLTVVGVLQDPFRFRDRVEGFDSLGMARSTLARRLEFKNLYFPRTLLGAGAPVNMVMIKAPDLAQVEPLTELAKETATRLGAKDLYIWNQKQWVEVVVSAADHLSVLGNLIWIVLLGVASIMIVTISLLTVRERFFEIALRRTEGARRREIILQFSIESVGISLVGGVLGMAMGAAFATGISGEWGPWEPVLFWRPVFSPWTFLLATSLSVVVGLLATVLPARAVAGLDPVRILRGGAS